MNYEHLASGEVIHNTTKALFEHNFQGIVVDTKKDALEKIKELIPKEASVMNGSSLTLREMGYLEYLKSGEHGWKNLHEKIVVEQDEERQDILRKQALSSDFYVGSAHAITETGEIVIASNSGSQLPHLVFTSPNIILVVGAQKITPNISMALERIEKHVVPLEDKRMKEVYGFGTTHAKTLILHRENLMMGRKIHVIIVKEKLGF